MTGSNRVRWEDVDRDTYEDMVAVLISRLHPTAQRIDGSGGDGGRDVLVPLETGLVIYQLKSHTGRVRGSRRTKIKNSLARAAEHEPAAWHLAVPVDPTPDELTWFEDLTRACPFPCHWRGKTWLDMHMSQMPEIYRYYLEGADARVIELIERLNLEGSALTDGAPGAIERFQALQTELNQIDPHYLFNLSSQPNGNVSVTVRARYPGAELDRPMFFRPQFTFPDTPEGQQALQDLQRSIDFGTPTTIPSEYVSQVSLDLPAGLGGEFEGGPLTLGGPVNDELPEISVFLQVCDTNNETVAQLPLNLISRHGGQRGAVLTFTDASESVTATLEYDSQEGRSNFNYRFQQPDQYNPFTLLPAVRLVASLDEGFKMKIVIDGREAGGGVPQMSTTFVQESRMFDRLLDDLTYLQSQTGIYFDIQRDLTDEEFKELEAGVRLLHGETLLGTWSDVSIDITRENYEMIEARGLDGPHQFRVVGNKSISIHGFTIPIGTVVCEFPSAAVSDSPVGFPEDPSESFPVTFVPADSNAMSTRLQTAEGAEDA